MTAKLMILMVAFLMAFSSPAAAAICWNESRDDFAARVFEKHGAVSVYTENLKAKGLKDNDEEQFWVIEAFANQRTRNWVMISYLKGKNRLCIILGGSGWVFDREA